MATGTSQAQPATPGGTTVIESISAQTSAALTEEQRKRRYEELRKRMGRPRLEVKGESGIHYFWAAREDTNEMDRLDLLGYSIVREPNPRDVLSGKTKPKIQAAGLKEDGTYKHGDVILMQCPMEVYEFLQMENEERSNQQQSAAKENFRYEAEKAGVPAFEVDKSKVRR